MYYTQEFPYMDDAYIYYRYAVNWASGYGPVFNINEYVEGNTNFLWTAILAIGAFFSFDPVSVAPVINLFFGISCLFLTSYICSFVQFSRPRLIAVVIPIICTLSYGVYLYGVSGMDTLLFSLVILLCIIVLCKSKMTGRYLVVPPFLFLLNITRPEAPLYATVLLAVLTYFVYMEQKKLPKQLIAAIITFIVLTMLLFVGRYIVYNEIIPSTIQAKGYAIYSIKKFLFSGDVKGLKDFIGVIISGFKYELPLLYLGAWVPYILLFINRNKKDFLLWSIAFLITTNVFVSIWAGGDFFPFKRHIIFVLPLLAIFVGWSIDLLICRYWKDSMQKRVMASFALVVMAFLWIGFFLEPTEFVNKKVLKPHLKSQFSYLQKFGILLRDMPVPTTLLTDRAGVLPYYAGIHVYVRDLFGLMDIHNAKYGDVFCTPGEGGVCGRTDYNYSFSTPFDVFIYNAININKRFVVFCKDNPSICQKYRFFKNEEWMRNRIYIIADINHPVSKALEDIFHAIQIPVDEQLLNNFQFDKDRNLFFQ
jgi:hypothetical protein